MPPLDISKLESIGRFAIKKILGRGSRGPVCLAFDPGTGRDVAINVLNATAFSSAQEQLNYLEKSKKLISFRHPNIVPLHECGIDEENCYLVFEYVTDPVFPDYLSRNARLQIYEALQLMEELLGAFVQAHSIELYHHALKPSDIFVGERGHIHIKGFNRHFDSVDFAAGGYYVSPEHVKHRPLDARADIFVLGLIFYEVITGRAPISLTIPQSFDELSALKNIVMPSGIVEGADARFDQIFLRATQLLPEHRYQSVRDFHAAINALLDVKLDQGKTDPLNFLMRRIKRKPDFPGLTRSIKEITRLSGDSENHTVAQLANAVLKDYAMTQKLLRLANSSFYGRFGGNIHTVTRAIMVLGFDQVRMIALSLMLLENLQNNAGKNQFANALIQSLYSAMVAREIGHTTTDLSGEQIFIAALMHNLGKLLTIYYFQEEYADICLIASQRPMTEDAAAKEVLGMDYFSLGRAVLKNWDFPEEIIKTLMALPAGVLGKSESFQRKLTLVSGFSNEFSSLLLDDQRDLDSGMANLAQRFGAALDLKRAYLEDLAKRSQKEMMAFLRETGLFNLARSEIMRVQNKLGVLDKETTLLELDEDVQTVEKNASNTLNPLRQLEILLEGVNDITATLVSDYDVNDLLQMILETIYRGTEARCVVLFFVKRETHELKARFAFGKVPQGLVGLTYTFSIEKDKDALSLAMKTGKDIVARNHHSAKNKSYLPEKLRNFIDDESFVILPVIVNNKAIGAFYLDFKKEVMVEDSLLSALKTLRNQAVLAIHRLSTSR